MTQNPTPTTSIRTEADLIAHCLHTLGYLPSNSAVFLSSSQHTLGPLIRLDLTPLADQGIEPYIDFVTDNLPTRLPNGDTPDRLFALFFSSRPDTDTLLTPPPTDPDADADFAATITDHILPLLRAVTPTPYALADAIAIGTHTYWALATDRPTLNHIGTLDDIYISPVYTHLIAQGSTVATSHTRAEASHTPNPLDTTDPAARDRWFLEAELAATTYAAARATSAAPTITQIHTDLTHWEAALTTCQQALTNTRTDRASCPADIIRTNLTPDTAGYLATSLTNTATLHYILYQTATTPTHAHQALAALAHTRPTT